MIDTNLVKIRKEKNYYLCYFVESRKVINVNKTGAKIIDLFFNKKHYSNVLNKNKNFLKELKEILKKDHRGGFPFIKEEQMDVPIIAELQLNTLCNLRCKHCCQKEYDKSMNIKKIENILKILHKAKIFEINLVGGELFLRPDIYKIVTLCCKKYNFAVNIITNGTLLSEKLIEKLALFKNNLAFLISIEGINEHNDEIRGKGTFKKIEKTLQLLRKNKIYFETSTTINAINIKHWKEITDYCEKLGISCNFNLFKPFKLTQQELIIKPNKYFKFIEEIFKYRTTHNSHIGLTNAAIVANMTKGDPRKECKATLSGLTIDVNGKMIPCPFLKGAGYYNGKNLPNFSKNFINKWKTNYWFKDFRKGNLNECQTCSYIFCGDKNKVNPYGLIAFKRHLKNKNYGT